MVLASLHSSAGAQQNSLREPRPFPQPAQPLAGSAKASSQLQPLPEADNQVPQMIVRSAVFQRAISEKGNAIRLASHNDSPSNTTSSSTLRWVDPGAPGEPLSDKPHTAWTKRGDARTAIENNKSDALSDPFAEPTSSSRGASATVASNKANNAMRSGSVAPGPAYTRQQQPAFDPFAEPSGRGSALPPLPVRQVASAPAQDAADRLPAPQPELPAPSTPDNAPLLDAAPSTPEAAPSTPDLAPSASDPAPPSPSFNDPPAAANPSSDAPAPSPELIQDDQATEGLPSDAGDDYQQGMLDPTASRNCNAEQARCRLVGATSIRDITLDITPDFSLEQDAAQRLEDKRQRLSAAPARSWSVDGEVVAEGRLADFSQGTVMIEQTDGTLRQIPMYRLDDADQCFVTAWWKLPLECRLSSEHAPARNFVPMTMTWTASGLCHKPLYFEQKNLERYGHAAHPLIQPALSGAHFFGSIVTLPYQMGIHPMYECRYDLGNYRVGSCAPWLLPPIPISLRGALLQAGVVTGGTFILP